MATEGSLGHRAAFDTPKTTGLREISHISELGSGCPYSFALSSPPAPSSSFGIRTENRCTILCV